MSLKDLEEIAVPRTANSVAHFRLASAPADADGLLEQHRILLPIQRIAAMMQVSPEMEEDLGLDPAWERLEMLLGEYAGQMGARYLIAGSVSGERSDSSFDVQDERGRIGTWLEKIGLLKERWLEIPIVQVRMEARVA